jgi:hypothetical protein
MGYTAHVSKPGNRVGSLSKVAVTTALNLSITTLQMQAAASYSKKPPHERYYSIIYNTPRKVRHVLSREDVRSHTSH